MSARRALLALAAAPWLALLAPPALGGPVEDLLPKKRTAVQVEVSGVEGELRDNVLQFLSLERNRSDPELSDALVERLHARAGGEIRAALKPFGYYRPKVESQLEPTDKGWLARYAIEPGEPTRLVAFDVAFEGPGQDDPAFQAALVDAPLRMGGVARHDRYELLKDRIQAAAEDNGYLDGRFVTAALEVDPGAAEARVRLRFATGEKLLFGPIRFEQDVVDQQLIDRYVTIVQGEPFSVRKLLDLQYALNDSDYFKLVEITPERGAVGPDRQVPVTVRLTPRERTKWSFGLGYATDTGPRGSIGYEDRRVNRSGHRAKVELEDSEIKTELQLTYTVPLERPASERLAFKGQWTEEQKGDTLSRRTVVGVSVSKSLARLRQTTYLDYEYEKTAQPLIAPVVSRLLVPGASLAYTETDAPLFVRRGQRVSLDVHGAHEGLVSDATFLQYGLSGKLVRSFGASRFITRASYASTLIADATELPASQRLFAGGDQSVRGYGYESIGPTDAGGNVIGGTEAASASVELDHLFTKEWGAAVFVDAGDAVDDSPLDPKIGAGVGVRWVSPIGMLRVDVGFPLTEGYDGWHLHLSIGPDL